MTANAYANQPTGLTALSVKLVQQKSQVVLNAQAMDNCVFHVRTKTAGPVLMPNLVCAKTTFIRTKSRSVSNATRNKPVSIVTKQLQLTNASNATQKTTGT